MMYEHVRQLAREGLLQTLDDHRPETYQMNPSSPRLRLVAYLHAALALIEAAETAAARDRVAEDFRLAALRETKSMKQNVAQTSANPTQVVVMQDVEVTSMIVGASL